ncbi:MAG: response regulator [Pirellulales bacterium]
MSGTKLRILVVDDNTDAGNTLCMLLRVKGHEVCIACDGLEAIDRAAEFRPKVILMDVGMPKLNGYEATRRIRELPGGDEFYIVALTGWTQPNDIECARQAGCSTHLAKPLDFPTLDRLLASLLPSE